MNALHQPILSGVDVELLREHAARRERIATAALAGLLGSAPSHEAAAGNADRVALRAVRYADALIEALNASTAAQLTQRQR